MAVASSTTEARVVLSGITWSTYEAILADMDNRPIHLTYDRGALEIMSPSEEHERVKKLIGRMIEAMTEELNIPIRSAGSTTFRREAKQRGLEPDECYYVASEPRVRGKDDFDLAVVAHQRKERATQHPARLQRVQQPADLGINHVAQVGGLAGRPMDVAVMVESHEVGGEHIGAASCIQVFDQTIEHPAVVLGCL